MKVIGIVGEYNPFHKGHAYHAALSRKASEEDCALVCVMSGDFVQRGSAAMYSKFARAEAAVKSGIDLVIELPTPWALSSAEGFARGAVGVLGALGVADEISFGSESGDAEALTRAAKLLLSDAADENIRKALSSNEGISFAAARQKAVEGMDPALAQLLSSPNNILGIEYIKAVIVQGLDIAPFSIKREGAGHDTAEDVLPRSASMIRSIAEGGGSISDDIPYTALTVYERENAAGRGPVFSNSLDIALVSRLRCLTASDFAMAPDCGEGLNDRIAAAVRKETSIDSIAMAAKSKRYALSRIRRILLCAALGIDKNAAMGIPPYARVLAANEKGCAVLKEAKKKSSIPIITKSASVKDLDDKSVKLFELCSDAHDLYVLGFERESERKGGEDWRYTPKII